MNLEAIFLKHGCTKAAYHTYAAVYEEFFGPVRERVENVLELGVLEGSSLKCWEEYFPRAVIHGIDCQLKPFEHSPRIKLYHGDTRDRNGFTKLCDSLPLLDIVIDDAGHVPNEQMFAVGVIWKRLKVGGVCAVEDIWDARSMELFAAFGARLFDLTPNIGIPDDKLAVMVKLSEPRIETRPKPVAIP